MRLIIQLMQQHYGGPSEVLVAAGHGRSYGKNSQVLVRELPGIVCSGLWRHLYVANSNSSPLPTYALLTDIGNDIPYGFAPKQILHWVSWCIGQLGGCSAQIVMTNLPMSSIEALSEQRFNLYRNVLFPSCRLSRSEVVNRAREIHQGLIDLAACHQLMLYEPASEWMSIDSIHIAFRKRRAFYQRLFKHFAVKQAKSTVIEGSRVPSISWLKRPQFAVRRVFGKVKYVSQPSGQLADQSIVSLY